MNTTVTTLAVSLYALNEKEGIVLRSLLEFMGRTLGIEIKFEQSEHSDIFIVDLDNEIGQAHWHRLEKLPVKRVACSANPVAQFETQNWIQKPLRGRAILEFLKGLHPAEERNSISPAISNTDTTQEKSGFEIVELLNRAESNDGMSELYGPCFPSLLLDVKKHRAYVSNHIALEDPDIRLDLTNVSLETNPPPRPNGIKNYHTERLECIFWFFAMHCTSGRLLSTLNPKGLYSLTRWPDFGELPISINQRRLAALMMARSATPERLARATQLPIEEVTAFLNATALCGWLRSEDGTSSVDRLLDNIHVRDTLQLIRGKLGLAS